MIYQTGDSSLAIYVVGAIVLIGLVIGMIILKKRR